MTPQQRFAAIYKGLFESTVGMLDHDKVIISVDGFEELSRLAREGMEDDGDVYEDMFHYVFHHGNEDWFPKKTTYGEWRKAVYQMMIDRGYWARTKSPGPPNGSTD